ncbi:glycosyltransferase [Arthrobacter sp. E3]|uniref:glycosyltransferase n=1 Tax=Arthrobacter sp. E3 TaxID=517402 RepID=UPI001A9527C1|nr:glycosyltransferase [Arthrobacter sp. E3]
MKAINYALVLAVLPKYRAECIGLLKNEFADDLSIYISDAHLDPSVKSGIPTNYYNRMTMHRAFTGKLFLQIASDFTPLRARNIVVDLNPRSVTAWLLLISRYIIRRRTLVWGHVHPQKGASSRTKYLRLAMRRLSAGTILYTYKDMLKARADLPNARVWVAPNSLYKAEMIRAGSGDSVRDNVLYVGRFEPAKKVGLLLKSFAQIEKILPDVGLVLVGGGTEEGMLRNMAEELGILDKVTFAGWIDDASDLEPIYDNAFCTVSPGFAGLGLTQSLGFGVPMIVADDEPHSPEIELAASGGIRWFASNSIDGLRSAIIDSAGERSSVPDKLLSIYVRERYSAERMAAGLSDALRNVASVDEEKL